HRRAARGERRNRWSLPAAVHRCANVGMGARSRAGRGARHRAAAGAPRTPPADRRRARRTSLMRWLNQVVQITLINLRNVPQRMGTSLVVVIGIAGVVGVLVSVLAMAEGFRHTLASTGRPNRVIMLRAGSDAELSSGVPRDQATLLAALPAVARGDGGRPLASAELVVMGHRPPQGEAPLQKRAG